MEDSPRGVQVRITFDVSEPGTHLVGVEQTFPAVDTLRRFRMPAWVPGSYSITDLGRNVQDVEASIDGRQARARQTGKDTWEVAGSTNKVVTLRYRVYARGFDVGSSHVTNDHAHLFPATLVMYDEHSRRLPHRVTLRKPRGWRTWSGLEAAGLTGRLRTAADYDELIDCPIEMGPPADYAVLSFDARRRKHRLVLWRPPEGMDADRIRRDVRKVVLETMRLWGEVPYDHYTFIGHVAPEHGGGLEHRNSTLLGVDPLDLVDEDKMQEHWLPLVCHEYFHTWNIKAVMPAAFTPYDLQRESYTGLLWLFEGFTTYYELPLLARAGVIDDEHWGKLAAQMLKYYEMALGRHHRSVADCSRLTWTLLYKAHEHNINRNVSYYTKGLWVGLCLDHHLRTHGVRDGLDGVMKELWRRHGKTGEGLPEDGFAPLVKQTTGVDVARLLGRWTEGTGELPIDKAMRDLGWTVTRGHGDDKKPLGLGIHFKPDGKTIERIPEDGPAYHVLQPDDEVVAIGGYKWKGERVAAMLNARKEGDEQTVTVFREGRLRELAVPIRTLPKDKIIIKPRKGDAATTKRRKAWLGR